jgi:hypothetical protein
MSDSTSRSATVYNTPFCGDLRSKKYYLLEGGVAQKAEDYLDDSNHCTCYHTQQQIGPDRGIVIPERCVPGRSCYRSALAAPKELR